VSYFIPSDDDGQHAEWNELFFPQNSKTLLQAAHTLRLLSTSQRHLVAELERRIEKGKEKAQQENSQRSSNRHGQLAPRRRAPANIGERGLLRILFSTYIHSTSWDVNRQQLQ
jgi:hypothetical protein